MEGILKLAMAEKENMVKYRRHLHQFPEVSTKEFKTIEYISKKLDEFKIEYIEVPNGGIIGFIGEKGIENKTVLLRADMDALAVDENEYNLNQKKQCVSQIKGVSHACGHDAHVAMLLSAGKILKSIENQLNGRVILFFERAEEEGGNILYLLRYLHESNMRVDGCFGMHVKGDLETGTFSVEKDGINAGGFGFEVKLIGKGGHGSAPSQANSPIDCFVALYSAFTSIPVKFVPAYKACSFSLGKVKAGSKRNIIPSELEFAGSFRFLEHDVGIKVKKDFLRLLEQICKSYECEYRLEKSIGPTLPLVNNEQCVDIAKESIAKLVGHENIVHKEQEMGSESFSAAQKLYPGVYVFLGIKNDEIGAGAENHSPEFDIDEEAMPRGVALEVAYAIDFLNNEKKIEFSKYAGTPDMLYEEICYKVD